MTMPLCNAIEFTEVNPDKGTETALEHSVPRLACFVYRS